MGMKNGLTRFGPFSRRVRCWSSKVEIPPMPDPTITPKRVGSTWPWIRDCSSACAVAATAYCTKRSERRTSFRSMTLSGLKSCTSPANRVSYAAVSKRVTGPIPDSPATSRFQNSSTEFPSGQMTPCPVTTTRRGAPFLRCFTNVLSIFACASKRADDSRPARRRIRRSSARGIPGI